MLLQPIWGYYGERSDAKHLEQELVEQLEATRVSIDEDGSDGEREKEAPAKMHLFDEGRLRSWAFFLSWWDSLL